MYDELVEELTEQLGYELNISNMYIVSLCLLASCDLYMFIISRLPNTHRQTPKNQ